MENDKNKTLEKATEKPDKISVKDLIKESIETHRETLEKLADK